MKSTTIIATLFLIVLSGYGQELATVHAVSSGEKIIDWTKEKQNYEKEYDDDAPEFFYNDCAQGVTPVKASSELTAQGDKSYALENINDENPMTAWMEGAKGNGIGEYFEVKAQGLNSIYNGYQTSPTAWKNNGRVKKFKVYVDGKPLCFLALNDEMAEQSFELPQTYRTTEDDNEVQYIFRLEIVEVYPGNKYQDVGISEIDYTLCCYGEGSRVLAAEGAQSVANIAQGSPVITLDLKTGKIAEKVVEKVSRQTHVTLLRVKAGGNTIEITPEHPLYVKGVGFVSLQYILRQKKLQSYANLAGQMELMIWDAGSQSTRYVTADSVERIEGRFNTYTLRAVSDSESYIVNGFVTKTY